MSIPEPSPRWWKERDTVPEARPLCPGSRKGIPEMRGRLRGSPRERPRTERMPLWTNCRKRLSWERKILRTDAGKGGDGRGEFRRPMPEYAASAEREGYSGRMWEDAI